MTLRSKQIKLNGSYQIWVLMQRHDEVAQTLQAIGQQTTTVVVVSKQHPIEKIAQAYTLGYRHFGENYFQEMLPKMEALSHLDITWHFIGHVQSNKAKALAFHADWVQSVCTQSVADKLSSHREAKKPLNICVQVTLDESENGILLNKAESLMRHIQQLPNLNLRGLLYKPPANLADPRAAFEKVHDFYATRQEEMALDTLSMGMTSDFQMAIKQGANMVRLGTYILGSRGQ